MSAGALIGAALLGPGVGVLLIVLARRTPNLREAMSFLAAGSVFVAVAALTPAVLAGGTPRLDLFDMLPGIPLAFAVEPLGHLFALTASGLWIVNTLYTIGYLRANHEFHQTRFFACVALALWATIAMAYAANLATFFVAYEILTLVTYPLVTHHGDEAAKRAGRLYLGILLGASILFLFVAVAATWVIAGTLDFRPGGVFDGNFGRSAMGALLALYVFGIAKSALMPLHRWLPAAMVAPTPVSALLHAVAVVKAGVFGVVKVIVYVFGYVDLESIARTDWLPVVAGFTIVAASLVALRSDNLKRRLAYSTISQLAYVVLAAAVLAPLSVVGASLHIVAHALGKITLFFAAGAIYTAAHKTEVSELDGLGRRMPVTMTAFALATLSMIGLPPTVGFVSKWFMLSGAIAAGHWVAVAVLVVGTALSAGYLLPVVHRAFLRPLASGAEHGEAPLTMVCALALTAALCVVGFFFADAALPLARAIAKG